MKWDGQLQSIFIIPVKTETRKNFAEEMVSSGVVRDIRAEAGNFAV